MKKYILLVINCVILHIANVKADEGMWPLFMLKQLEDPMKARGLNLTAEQIYSINNSSLKDAVVRLTTRQGRMFCTGEIISDQGLFLTNHHCGYGSIQELSTPANNYLKYGFWAKSKQDELQANFGISILKKVEEVTAKVVLGLNKNMSEKERMIKTSQNIELLKKDLLATAKAEGNEWTVDIIPFYNNNKFIALYYETFQDVRLVGTPPENIGKFGGETDNWMWPRHTCDFSMFRIYANKDNKPSIYNAQNKPYTPKHVFPISIKGYEPGDYAMIMGYPGRTNRYSYSENIKYMTDKALPTRVALRRATLDRYEKYMYADTNIRLMYADKYAGLSNYWKKFLGEKDGLKNLKIYERKKEFENQMKEWINKNNKQEEYGEMWTLMDEAYAKQNEFGLITEFFNEGLMNIEAFKLAAAYVPLYDSLNAKKKNVEYIKQISNLLKMQYPSFFKEYYKPIDRDVCEALLKIIYESANKAQLPLELTSLIEKSKFNYAKVADMLFKKSIFCDSNKLSKFLNNPNAGILKKDPIMKLVYAYVYKINNEFKPNLDQMNDKLMKSRRLFLAAMLEMEKGKSLSPDANATMRLTYGQVLPYNAKDALTFKEYTTSEGILEKYKPRDIEFDAPVKLISLLKERQFGDYADKKDGKLHTCFLTNNDITGGNSGSPVINADGELIGTAFDGNWEAISSDYAFEPELQRTISLDIRYTLFIIDKYAGASHLINEMDIRR